MYTACWYRTASTVPGTGRGCVFAGSAARGLGLGWGSVRSLVEQGFRRRFLRSGSGEQRSSSPSHPIRHMSKSYPLGTHKIIIIIIRRRLNLYICPVVPCVVRIIISVTYVRSPLPNPAACRDRSRTYVRPGPYDYDACLYIYGHLI